MYSDKQPTGLKLTSMSGEQTIFEATIKPIEQFLFSYQGTFNVSKRYYTRRRKA